MKLLAHFGPWKLANLDSKLSRELRQICPHSVAPVKSFWEIKLPHDDPMVDRIIQVMRKHGWIPKPPSDAFRKDDKSLAFYIVREYSKADFDQVKFLRPRPEMSIDRSSRSKHGKCVIGVEEFHPLKPIPEIAETDAGRLCVTERLMKKMLAFPLQGIRFDPMECQKLQFAEKGPKYIQVDWPEASGPYWEVSSDHRMPPVAANKTLVQTDGRPFNGDNSKGCFAAEEYFSPTEFHYNASSIKRLGNHDVFEMVETFLPVDVTPQKWHHQLIVSQRFRQFCLVENLPMDWIPVRIDPD